MVSLTAPVLLNDFWDVSKHGNREYAGWNRWAYPEIH
jgi:hypothetical protein